MITTHQGSLHMNTKSMNATHQIQQININCQRNRLTIYQGIKTKEKKEQKKEKD